MNSELDGPFFRGVRSPIMGETEIVVEKLMTLARRPVSDRRHVVKDLRPGLSLEDIAFLSLEALRDVGYTVARLEHVGHSCDSWSQHDVPHETLASTGCPESFPIYRILEPVASTQEHC